MPKNVQNEIYCKREDSIIHNCPAQIDALEQVIKNIYSEKCKGCILGPKENGMPRYKINGTPTYKIIPKKI